MPTDTTSTSPDLVEVATTLSTSDFITRYLPPAEDWRTYTHVQTSTTLGLSLISATDLPDDALTSCFRLIEESSKSDYERSTLGWKPASKKKEMRLLDLKYLLLRSSTDSAAPIVGFVSFMPTYEDDVSCLYVYEIHLGPSYRGIGLGYWLLALVQNIAAKVGVEMVMLTVCLRNHRARTFYHKIGFRDLEIVSGRRTRRSKDSDDESGYVIMSKDVGSNSI